MNEFRLVFLSGLIAISACEPNGTQISGKGPALSVREIVDIRVVGPPERSRFLVHGRLVDGSPHDLIIKDDRCGDYCKDILGISGADGRASVMKFSEISGMVRNSGPSGLSYIPAKMLVSPVYVDTLKKSNGKSVYRIGRLELIDVMCANC